MSINIKGKDGKTKMKISDDLDSEDIIIDEAGKETSYLEAAAAAEDATQSEEIDEEESTDGNSSE